VGVRELLGVPADFKLFEPVLRVLADKLPVLGVLRPFFLVEVLRPFFLVAELRPFFLVADLRPFFLVADLRPVFLVADLRPVFLAELRPFFLVADLRPLFLAEFRPFFLVADLRPLFLVADLRPFFLVEDLRPFFLMADLTPVFFVVELVRPEDDLGREEPGVLEPLVLRADDDLGVPLRVALRLEPGVLGSLRVAERVEEVGVLLRARPLGLTRFKAAGRDFLVLTVVGALVAGALVAARELATDVFGSRVSMVCWSKMGAARIGAARRAATTTEEVI